MNELKFVQVKFVKFTDDSNHQNVSAAGLAVERKPSAPPPSTDGQGRALHAPLAASAARLIDFGVVSQRAVSCYLHTEPSVTRELFTE